EATNFRLAPAPRRFAGVHGVVAEDGAFSSSGGRATHNWNARTRPSSGAAVCQSSSAVRGGGARVGIECRFTASHRAAEPGTRLDDDCRPGAEGGAAASWPR